eukprot:1151279-Pelagomonas_calceolata.AAC.1
MLGGLSRVPFIRSQLTLATRKQTDGALIVGGAAQGSERAGARVGVQVTQPDACRRCADCFIALIRQGMCHSLTRGFRKSERVYGTWDRCAGHECALCCLQRCEIICYRLVS